MNRNKHRENQRLSFDAIMDRVCTRKGICRLCLTRKLVSRSEVETGVCATCDGGKGCGSVREQR